MVFGQKSPHSQPDVKQRVYTTIKPLHSYNKVCGCVYALLVPWGAWMFKSFTLKVLMIFFIKLSMAGLDWVQSRILVLRGLA